MFKLFQPKWQVDEVPFPTLLSGIKSITVISFEDEQCVDLSKDEIERFLLLFKKGSFKNMFKCATSYEVKIKHLGGTTKYYIHADAIGPFPGGLKQVIFTPKSKSFSTYIEKIYTFKTNTLK